MPRAVVSLASNAASTTKNFRSSCLSASSCSIACNRTHRENHPAEPESNPRADIAPVANKEELTSAQDPANPFRALDSSGRLRLLFQKYPNLPEQLLQIYAATQPPPATSSKPAIPESLMRGLPQKETWNHDLGVRSGKEALRKARKAGGRDGDAIREYSELILHLMDRDGVRNDATNVFERQVAQQDAKFIEQLMAREKHQG